MTKSILKNIEKVFRYVAAAVLILTVGVYIGSRSKTTTKLILSPGKIDKSRFGVTNGICVQAVDIDSSNFTPISLKLYDKSCALFIGIDEYDSLKTGFAPLKQAVTDTEKVRAKLGEFQFNSIVTLKNSHATKQNLLNKMRMLMREAGPDGALFIYFAGHGYRHPKLKGRGYLIPYDGSRKFPALDDRNISMASLRKLAKESNVKHVFITLDCCYSALFCSRDAPASSGGSPDIYRLAHLTAEPVINVLVAAGRDEPGVDGLFADAFIDALDMFKQNAFVTAGDIAYHISREVPRRARKLFRVQNTASTKLFPSSGEFVFARTNSAPVAYSRPDLSLIKTFNFTNIQDHTALNICDIDDNGDPDFLKVGDNVVEILDDSGMLIYKKTFDFKPGKNPKRLKLFVLEDITKNGCKEIVVGFTIYSTNWVYILDHQLRVIRTFSCLNTVFSKLTVKKSDILKNNLGKIADEAANNSKRLAKTWFRDDIWAISNQFKGLVWIIDGNSVTVDLFFAAINGKNNETNAVSPEKLIRYLKFKSFWCDKEHFNTLSNHGIIYSQKTSVDRIVFADVNDDYYPDLLVSFSAGYGLTPRGIVAFDFRTCKPIWRFPTASGTQYLNRDFDPVTGEKVILLTCGSNGTGYKMNDGTDDSHAYVHLINQNGKLRWRKEIGGIFNYALSQFADLDMNGDANILVATWGASSAGLGHIGRLCLLDKNSGKTLANFNDNLGIDSFAIIPDYENKQNTVAAGLRNGKIVHLDSKLREISSVSFAGSSSLTNSADWYVEPALKGLLRTFYGEFIVVYYTERQSYYSGVRSDMGRHPSIKRNEHLKLLNLKTLEEEYNIPICMKEVPNIELENDNKHLPVIQDIDQDGQDEILVYHKDRVNVYKLTLD